MIRKTIACAVTVALPLAASAQPLGTAFTYQGELRTAGVSASGMHDLRFRLHDALTGGGQVGSTVCLDNVALTDGRFSAVLDFGAQFNGQQRFLEIDVRADTGLGCANVAGFMTLAPRQPLTAAPYSVFALSAGSATTAGTATTATTATTAGNAMQLEGQSAAYFQNATNLNAGTIGSARIGGTYTGALSFSNPANSYIGSGGGLTNLNATSLVVGTLPSGRLSGTYDAALTLNNASNWFVGTFTGVGPGLTDLNASNISSGTLAPSRLPVPLELTSAAGAGSVITGYASSAAGATVGVTGNCESSGGVGVQGAAYGITGFTIGVEGRNFNSPTGTGVVGTANATGGFFEAYGTSGTGLFGINQSSTGSTYGVQGRVSSPNGTAIRGESTSTGLSGHGVVGVTQSSAGGIGVWGTHANSSGTGVGVLGDTYSPTSKGVSGAANATTGSGVGVHGVSYGPQGYGVFGVSNSTNGYSVGVQGEASFANPSGTGVVGKAAATGGYFAATGPGSTGVWGQSETNSSGTGVYGSTASPSGWGVVGSATSPTGICFGVYGAGPPSGWGVYAQGNSGASGSKAFRIDHPADPENQYLLHYSAESPEVINFYSGKATLDANGEASVELPAYFARINTDPRYSLTAVGAPMPRLHISREIDEGALGRAAKAGPDEAVPQCAFGISGGVPGGRVCWRVEAVRNDRWMQAHQAAVEMDKADAELGTYQHPELYGKPDSMGAPRPRTADRSRP